jgi:Omp85 superfamily domain
MIEGPVSATPKDSGRPSLQQTMKPQLRHLSPPPPLRAGGTRAPVSGGLTLRCVLGTASVVFSSFVLSPAAMGDTGLVHTSAATSIDPQQDLLAPERLEAIDAVIGDIRISNGDIFDTSDPKESGVFYRMLNTLHIQTRPEVIRRQLLLQSGDLYTVDTIAETERLLRANKYLQSAEIQPIRLTDGAVDLEVRTEDTWTLSPGFSFSHKGGASTGGFELEEANLFGTGSGLKLGYKSRVERDEAYFGYRDGQLGNTRLQLDTWAANASDGSSYRINLQQPFYAMDARRAGGVHLESFEQVDPLYQLGDVYDEVHHDARRAEVFYGWSKGLIDEHVSRLSVGLGYDAHEFAGVDNAPRPPESPADRRDVYPFVAWEWLENRYETTRNADNIARIEDRYLGTRIGTKLGYASSAFGSNDNAWLYGIDAQRGFKLAGDTLLLFGTLRGRDATRDPDSYRVEAGARWYHRQTPNRLLFGEVSGMAGQNVDPDVQITLGGDNGLRGYPMRYQSGNAVALLTLEERFYTDWYPFHLFNVGAAAFFDMGRAWAPDASPAAGLGLLRDVGVGLRLGTPHSSSGRMLHLDVAYPLDGPDDIRHAQFIIETSTSF